MGEAFSSAGGIFLPVGDTIETIKPNIHCSVRDHWMPAARAPPPPSLNYPAPSSSFSLSLPSPLTICWPHVILPSFTTAAPFSFPPFRFYTFCSSNSPTSFPSPKIASWRERERENKQERRPLVLPSAESERGIYRERERVCLCVCVTGFLCFSWSLPVQSEALTVSQPAPSKAPPHSQTVWN